MDQCTRGPGGRSRTALHRARGPPWPVRCRSPRR
jgi:hypothetical protein